MGVYYIHDLLHKKTKRLMLNHRPRLFPWFTNQFYVSIQRCIFTADFCCRKNQPLGIRDLSRSRWTCTSRVTFTKKNFLMKCRDWDHIAWTRRHVYIYTWQIHYGWKLHSRARICFWTTKQRTSFLQSPSKSLINCYKLSSYKAKKITNYKSQRELTKHM